jgi:ATP-dependent Clp protease ATP-binding subunit ClpX
MEHATVCLDEVDKVSGMVGGKPYVTGINIQQALLTLIEGEQIVHPLTIFENGEPKRHSVTIHTQKMLFLCAGAFEALYDQVFKRVTSPTSRVKLPTETVFRDGEVRIQEYFSLRQHFKQEDLFDYGMQPQFLSRFDNSIILEDLHEGLLRRIFTETDDSVFKASQRFFKRYDIDLQVTDDAVERIAAAASEAKRIGARALKEVWGRIIKPFEFDPFSHEEVQQKEDGKLLVINDDVVLRALKPSI